jgi:hypothetical protein
VANPPAAESQRRPFAFAGQVTVWDPTVRHLELGLRTFQVAPTVPMGGVTVGVQVALAGYVERTSLPSLPARWIVTQISVG